jgi:hypothetical protein
LDLGWRRWSLETLLRPATESVNGEIEALSPCVLPFWRSKNQTQRRKAAKPRRAEDSLPYLLRR